MNQIVSRGHTRPLTEITFVRDGTDNTLLVSAAHDKLPQVRSGETGNWIGTFRGHKGAVWSCKVDSFTRTLAGTASGDFTAKLWSVQSGKEIIELKHKHVVKSFDFSYNSELFATGCQDGLIRVYTTCQPEKDPVEIKVSNSGNDDGITKISWLDENDATLIIVGKKNGIIETWDIRQASGTPCLVSSKLSPSAPIMDLEVNNNFNTILVSCGNKVVQLGSKDLTTKKEFVMPSTLTFSNEGGASLSPDGNRFICGGSDLWLREYDFHSGEIIQTYKGHHGPIRCVRYHPNGTIGASGSEDATIRFWNLEDTEN